MARKSQPINPAKMAAIVQAVASRGFPRAGGGC
jgi:hypothetical protein